MKELCAAIEAPPAAWIPEWAPSDLRESVESIRARVARAERRSLQAELALSDSEKLQERFLETLSKDIRGPVFELLAGLRSLSHITANRTQMRRLDSLYGAAFRVLGSINDVVELGNGDLHSEAGERTVCIGQLAQDLAEVFGPAVTGKNDLVLAVMVSPSLPYEVKVDPQRILHMLGNVIENAIRHTKKGRIEIAIVPAKIPAEQPDWAAISITCRDTGEGIPAERLEALQSELMGRPAERGAGALGLGLRSAAKIARQYRGALRIAPRQHGTDVVMTLQLPVVSAQRAIADVPKIFHFIGSSEHIFIGLSTLGFFHRIKPISIEQPLKGPIEGTLFIEATDVFSGRAEELRGLAPKEQCVVLVRYDELYESQRLLDLGYSRTLALPLTSPAFIAALLELDDVARKRQNATSVPLTQKLQILVVDDVATARIRISDKLTRAGHHVVEADDGLSFVERIAAGERFDIVFCDLTMGTLDGVGAMQQVRAFEANQGRRTPIVAMTAYSLLDSERLVGPEGFDAVLRKPVHLDELDFLIANLVGDGKIRSVQPVFSRADLEGRTGNNPVIMQKVLSSFRTVVAGKLSELRAQVGPDRSDAAARSLHAIKGLLLEVGAAESAERLQAIESAVRGASLFEPSQLDEVEMRVLAVCATADQLERELLRQQEFADHGSQPER
jgi:signal transduction histidine kinase/CheY-like chemotaxis protein